MNAAKTNNFGFISKGNFLFYSMDINKTDELNNSPLFYAAGHHNIKFC